MRPLHENPFLSPDEPVMPAAAGAESSGPNRPRLRVLEAPFDALTESDFEATLSSLLADSGNIEGEIEFLQEIDGDPDDIAELQSALEAVKTAFSQTSARFDEWKRAVQHAGANEAQARADRLAAAAEAAEMAETLAEAWGLESVKKPIKAAKLAEAEAAKADVAKAAGGAATVSDEDGPAGAA